MESSIRGGHTVQSGVVNLSILYYLWCTYEE